MLVFDFDTTAIFGFFKTDPDIFGHLGVGHSSHAPFQGSESFRRKGWQGIADDLRAFCFRKGLQFLFQHAYRHAFTITAQRRSCKARSRIAILGRNFDSPSKFINDGCASRRGRVAAWKRMPTTGRLSQLSFSLAGHGFWS